MRACLLSDIAELTLSEREQPTIGENEVLIRIDKVGICGSDLHYYENGENSGNTVRFPHILGHEAAGTIVETGENVTDRSEAEHVAIEPGLPCGECEFCTGTGTYHLCESMEYMSSPPVDGALQEFVAWPSEYTYPLPESVSLQEGALVEPLSVALHACERAGVAADNTVLVTGGGPIGQLVASVAKSMGAGSVVLTDVVSDKLALAAERGIDYTVDSSLESPAEFVRESVDRNGVDILLECSGAASAIEATTSAVKRGGTITFVGVPIDAAVPTDVVDLIGNEYDLKGSFRFSNTYEKAIDGIRNGRYDVESIISFENDFEDTEAAFDRALDPGTTKGMIRVSE